MKYTELEQNFINDFSVDTYTQKIDYITREQVLEYLKQSYLIGRIQGIKFGVSYLDGSDRPTTEVVKLESVLDYIQNGNELK